MRRLYTALGLTTAILLFAACAQAFQVAQALINAPGNLVTAVRGPGDTVNYPIRYETRPTATLELILRADGTYAVRNTQDSTVADTGHYTVAPGFLYAGVCRMTLAPVWLKGDCFGKGRMWRESPQNSHWPPFDVPKDTTKTAYAPSDPRRSFRIVTVPA